MKQSVQKRNIFGQKKSITDGNSQIESEQDQDENLFTYNITRTADNQSFIDSNKDIKKYNLAQIQQIIALNDKVENL